MTQNIRAGSIRGSVVTALVAVAMALSLVTLTAGRASAHEGGWVNCGNPGLGSRILSTVDAYHVIGDRRYYFWWGTGDWKFTYFQRPRVTFANTFRSSPNGVFSHHHSFAYCF